MPPLALTGERTLPDVPEENYWFRRHLAVYEWIAERCRRPRRGRHGLRRGLRHRRAGAARPARDRRRRQPGGVRARRGQVHPPGRALRARPGRDATPSPATRSSSSRRSSTSRSPSRCSPTSRRCAPVAYVSTPNVLTLAPPGAEKSDNPWHVREYRARRVPGAVRERLRPRRAATASSTRASCRPRARAARRLGRRARRGSASPSRSTTASRRRSRRATSRCARGRSTARSTSSRCCDERARPGALALVLHSHMPYVEGFGTWPFGEEWLWEAVACVYLPLLELLDGAPVTVGLTPVLCDQLEAMRGEAGDRSCASCARSGRPIHAEDAAGLERGERARAGRRGAPRRRRLRARRAGLRAPRPRPAGRVRRARAGVELWTSSATHALLPLLATDAGLRLQLATGIASHQRRFGGWDGGFWLPECAYAPGLERDLADHGVRAFCVDQTPVAGLRPPATRSRPRPARWRCRSTGRRSSWSGTTATATRRTTPTATTTAAPCTTCSRGTTAARPTTAAPRSRWRASTRATSWSAPPAASAGGGLLCCALDTELLGHWWYEGPAWLGAVLEEAPRQGLELVTVGEGLERRRARAGRARRVDLGARTRTCPPGTRRAVGRSPSRRAARSCARWPRPPATRARAQALERAARELLALQSSDWAFLVTRELAADYPRERAAGPRRGPRRRARRSGRLRRALPEPALRNLAPDLDLASLTAP